MDGRDLARWRLRNLGLSGAGLDAPEQVVGWLGAVQAQDYGPAKWSLAQRTRGADDAAVERAFADGTILRTHVLRPTWHFVVRADIRWLLELTAPRVHAFNAAAHRRLGLDAAVLDKAAALLAAVLRGGQQRTRRQLEDALRAAGIATDGGRLVYLLMHAELQGVVCSGPPHGRQHTYALLEERAARSRRLGREQALAELAVRYFSSHGPATAKDLRWWSSLPAADVDEGLRLAGSRLQQVVVDGSAYWFAGSPPLAPPAAPAVHLLQTWDEYVVGYRDSRWLLDVAGAAGPLLADRPAFNNVVVLDGQVAGRWKRTLQRDAVVVQAALHAPFDHAQTRALQAAADRLGAFLGLPATVVTRAH